MTVDGKLHTRVLFCCHRSANEPLRLLKAMLTGPWRDSSVEASILAAACAVLTCFCSIAANRHPPLLFMFAFLAVAVFSFGMAADTADCRLHKPPMDKTKDESVSAAPLQGW